MMKMRRTELLLLAAVLFTSSLLSVTSATAQSLSRKHESRDDVDRREKVKDAMLLAWSSYEKFAWGFDELQPKTKDGVDSLGGLGATIVDALDTLFIMGLDEQFNRARQWVATSLDVNKDTDVSVFETTIRVVGGLLSAYDLSGDKMFLQKATEVADRLIPAWDTPSGVPLNRINLGTGVTHNYDWAQGSILADIGTEQLEFIALSERTNNKKYQQKVENVISVLHKNFPADGLVPVFIDPDTGLPVPSAITFGALGDSFYEYLLKAWVQGNKTEAVSLYREMWETSITKGMQSLIRKTTPSGYTYICEKNGDALSDTMDELACFTAGMLALGSSDFADPHQAKRALSLAEELARTCYNFYHMTTTKLAGENYDFSAGQDMILNNPYNMLRPETVESLFYLWRFTNNEMYRDWGWNIFQAFEKNSRLDTGYVGLTNVNTGDQDNTQESFFLAETLKYFYLLFSDPSVIPLDQWVFNTEAHPLKIVTRTTAFGGSSRGASHGRKQSPGRGRKHR